MNKLLVFGFLVSLIVALTQASLLVVEEGTPQGDDWRQLRVELLPATFSQTGDINWAKPVWTRIEGTETLAFPVLGSLDCDETVNMSVAARIDGIWQCVDINDPQLPPNSTARRLARQIANLDRVEPPASCLWDEAPLLFNVSHQEWQCADPNLSLIQFIRTPGGFTPPRPVCNDTDLVVFHEGPPAYYECRALNTIKFNSTISKIDNRWQHVYTTRSIGNSASAGGFKSGAFNNFRWSLYAFVATSESIAYDQSSPPQMVTSGGANWIAWTASTQFVAVSSLGGAFVKATFSPIYPSIQSSYSTNLTKTVPGSLIRGDNLMITPVIVTFNQAGSNSVNNVTTSVKYWTATAGPTGGLLVQMISNVTVAVGNYPALQIDDGNWYVGTTPDYNVNLQINLGIWLQYVDPAGF